MAFESRYGLDFLRRWFKAHKPITIAYYPLPFKYMFWTIPTVHSGSSSSNMKIPLSLGETALRGRTCRFHRRRMETTAYTFDCIVSS